MKEKLETIFWFPIFLLYICHKRKKKMNDNEKLKFFSSEIELINDADLKEFARTIIKNANDYFFHVPASSSGKYHPEFALGEGGLVRHTKAVIRLSRYLGECKGFNLYALDMVTVAALAHDIKKQGEGNEEHTLKEHPECAAHYLDELYENGVKTSVREDIFETIKHAVLTHMGQWGSVKPSNIYDEVVHEADYIASRKDFNMKFS